jgi:hypothetical protein
VLEVIGGRGGSMKCTVCTWVISHVKGEIASHGCTAAELIFASVCAAIPFVDVDVPTCVWVLRWGCKKLAKHLEDGVVSSTTLCNDVFYHCCK